jgi:hypothetical protein
MASTERDGGPPVLNDLLLHSAKGAKMEQKQSAISSYPKYPIQT